MYQGTIFMLYYMFFCFSYWIYFVYVHILNCICRSISIFILKLTYLNYWWWCWVINNYGIVWSTKKCFLDVFFDKMNPHCMWFLYISCFSSSGGPKTLILLGEIPRSVNIHCLYVVHVVDKLIIVIFCVTSKCFIW